MLVHNECDSVSEWTPPGAVSNQPCPLVSLSQVHIRRNPRINVTSLGPLEKVANNGRDVVVVSCGIQKSEPLDAATPLGIFPINTTANHSSLVTNQVDTIAT